MLTTILIVLVALWLLGMFGPADAGYRTWGNGVGYPGVGALIVIILLLALLHVIVL